MKRFVCLFCALLFLCLTACATAGDGPIPTPEPTPTAAPTPTPEPTPEPTPTPTPEPVFYHPLTGVQVEEDLSAKKPVAIMMNNIEQALPQQGNSCADIIYEVLAEGGITRMVAVFLDARDAGTIASVRSARQYFWEIARGHDAVYIHAGGSPEFYDNKASSGAFTVDGVRGTYSSPDAGMFWRDYDRIPGKTYAMEHTLVTSGEAVTNMLNDTGLLTHTEGYTYEMDFADDGTPAGGETANTITASFSNYKSTTFRYDETDRVYKVEEFGGAYIDGNTNEQIAVTNVIVLQTSCRTYDDYGRIDVDLSSGEGWFACGGRIIPIKWEKGSPESQFRYFTGDGQPLTLGRGKSFVAIIPMNRSMTAE